MVAMATKQKKERRHIWSRLVRINGIIFFRTIWIWDGDYIRHSIEFRFLSYALGDGGGRPSSVMSLGVTSVGGHSHGHPASPIGVGSLWEDIDPRSPEPLVVRGGWLWLIWVVRWTT